MGCLASKLEDDEAVLLCKDRKDFIKRAVEYRNKFVITHVAYIESLKRVSAALIHYVDVNDQHQQFFNSFIIPPLRYMKRQKPLIRAKNKPKKSTARVVVNYLKPGGYSSIPVEKEPEQEETMRTDSYHPTDYYGFSSFSAYTTNSQQHHSDPSSSLHPHGYPVRNNTENILNGDDIAAIRKIREAEGIPELEEAVDDEEGKNEKPKAATKHAGVQVSGETSSAIKQDSEEELVNGSETNITEEQTPIFRVHTIHRPNSMAEVMKEMEKQFLRIVDCAYRVLAMLQESRAHHNPASKELPERMLNPFSSSGSKDEGEKNKNYCSMEQSCIISANHQSSLGRLYEWEKKLYKEVKTGERVRKAYERKCKQFKGHDINGEDPFEVDKTRATMRGLHTQLVVYLNTIESIGKRIGALRDLELCPQLVDLIYGLGQMWKTMAACHTIQKRTIEEAKVLFSGVAAIAPPKSPGVSARLAAEIRNWGRSLQDWIHAQCSYSLALSGWVSRCAPAGGGSGGQMPPVCAVCLRWSRLLDSLNEAGAVEGMEFFAAGMASLRQHQREATRRTMPPSPMAGNATDVEHGVLLVGMSAAIGSLVEFAVVAAEGYHSLANMFRRASHRPDSNA
ncbi:hypothetical protein HPP92_019458 [Vanilla planifolia]|uniref:Uncharacterized protein n=1 Tax=Vanilla planifolia TaxID=51239 RepID=A0A835UJC1_VANPL|nr:hypothetical protein HPP92_019458 [Vanilla planifolia]